MEYADLRKYVQNLKKYDGCRTVERCPLIHDGFPGTFNLSFAEYQLLKDVGRYQYYENDLTFSSVQEVVRYDDIIDAMKKSPHKYLGVFELADVSGIVLLKDKVDLDELQRTQIDSTLSLLNSLGIQNKNIFPKYCGGGQVKDLTKGKYGFDFVIPEDSVTKEEFIRRGVPERNMNIDFSRDAFLALNLASGPMGWGYRVEMDVKWGEEMLDVGTIEVLKWDPVFTGGVQCANVTGLKDITYTVGVTGVGLERLFVLMQGLDDVRKIPHIKELYDLNGGYSEQIEYLRVLHAIYSDVNKYSLSVSKHRRSLLNSLIRQVDFEDRKLENILELNAGVQPWHPELKEGIDFTMEKILNYRSL